MYPAAIGSGEQAETAPHLKLVSNLSSAEIEQQVAFDNLPPYSVWVVRRTDHKDPVVLPTGKIRQETVRYSDGAVRLVTIGEPNRDYQGERGVSPIAISSGDPWFTGPSGFNRAKIEELMELGFPVVWNHHQGRHAVWPTSLERVHTVTKFLHAKDVGRSAHHDHVLLDSLKPNADFSDEMLIREGYSRSGMAGEAFIALAGLYGRIVGYSDLDAACYAHKIPHAEMAIVLGMQALEEQKALLGVSAATLKKVWQRRSFKPVTDLLGTFDPHVLNTVHELAWSKPLVNGDAGDYAMAVPLDTSGVRTFFSGDLSSQPEHWKRIHRYRPNLAIFILSGAHFTGAHPGYLDQKYGRFEAVRTYMREHNESLEGITPEDVLPPKKHAA